MPKNINQVNHRRMHTISNKLSEPGRLKYTLKRIRLRFAQYKGKPVIQLLFAYDNELISHTKKIKTARWSNSMKSWYIPYSSKDELRLLHEHFKSKAYIDTKLIETSLKKMEQSLSTKAESLSKPSEKIKQEINLFSDWMRNKRYSESTIKTYTGGLQLFFRFLGNKSPEEVGNGDLERFHKEYIIANQYSVSFQSQVINAVKLFFSKRHRRKLDPELIDRPKKPKLLPNVLSKEEVKQVLEAHGNQKHRAMLSLIYACGLRRGELLNLKLQDVDSKRGLLIIRQSKGKKDRVVPVSERLLGLLREYYKRERPVTYLFEGQNAGTSYSEKSLESVLKQALAKAKITKPVTLHWLRHSYATHLLESGTDLRYIQKLLGHNSSRTTEIYTHVGTKSLQKIKSPFDDL